MAGAVAARWLLTAVFAAAGLGSLPVDGRVGTARVAARVSEVFHALMCTALIVMTWRSEPIAPTWFELALFGCAVIWFGLAGRGGVAGFQVRRLPGLHHALMAGAMIWMITAMPAAMRMRPAGPARICHALHIPARCARSGAGRLRPARSVLRVRSCAMVGVCHRSWAARDRQSRSRSRRHECRDGGDAAGDALNQAKVPGTRQSCWSGPPCRVIRIAGVEGGEAGGARAGRGGGRANGSRVRGAARENGTAAVPGHILAIGLADGNWRPT